MAIVNLTPLISGLTVGALFPDSWEAGRDVKQGWVLPSHMEMPRLLACPAWLSALLQPWALPGGNHAEVLDGWGLFAPLSCESVSGADGTVRRCCGWCLALCLC